MQETILSLEGRTKSINSVGTGIVVKQVFPAFEDHENNQFLGNEWPNLTSIRHWKMRDANSTTRPLKEWTVHTFGNLLSITTFKHYSFPNLQNLPSKIRTFNAFIYVFRKQFKYFPWRRPGCWGCIVSLKVALQVRKFFL